LKTTLLIDYTTHKRWIWATAGLAAGAVLLHLALGWDTPGGLTGGMQVGLWYGIAGSALMLFAGALSLHRRLPVRWWLGARRTWLKGHLWLGLLSGVLILCHSGYRWGGPLEVALWVVLIVTVLSGVLGLVLQQVLPRAITTRIQSEAPVEQVPFICDVLRREADALVAGAKADDSTLDQLRLLYEKVRPFLAAEYDRGSLLADPLQAEVLFGRVRALPDSAAVAGVIDRLEVFCDERRQLGQQARLHRWLHGWLLIHIPVTVVLLVLGVAHAWACLYY
jgi:hypothetical protein